MIDDTTWFINSDQSIHAPASMASMVLETQAHFRSTMNSWPSALCCVVLCWVWDMMQRG